MTKEKKPLYKTPTGSTKKLEDFTYEDDDVNDVIFRCLGNLNMLGVTGPISYSSGEADPDRSISIQRLQGL